MGGGKCSIIAAGAILFDATSSEKILCGGISSGEISLVGISSAATSFVANLKDHRDEHADLCAWARSRFVAGLHSGRGGGAR